MLSLGGEVIDLLGDNRINKEWDSRYVMATFCMLLRLFDADFFCWFFLLLLFSADIQYFVLNILFTVV